MAKSRKHGNGSIEEYRPGKWRIRYVVAGDRHTKAGYNSEKEAQAALREVLTDVDRGEWRDERKGRVLFSEFVLDYMEVRKAELAPGTYRNYETLLRTALIPTFGAKAMNDITAKLVSLWWARHAAKPVNRRNGYFLLSSIMRTAVEWEVIRSSPCIIRKAGKDVATPRPTYTVVDFDAVLKHVPAEFKAPLEFMFSAHLRLGELIALNGSDYKDGRVWVSKQVTDQGITKGTKTGQVREALKLFQRGIDAMEAHPRAIGATPLFSGPRGGRLPRNTLRKVWLEACEAAGYEDFRLHDLRHISLSLIGDSPLKVIQARGGHATITASMRYQHKDTSAEDDAVTRADQKIQRA